MCSVALGVPRPGSPAFKNGCAWVVVVMATSCGPLEDIIIIYFKLFDPNRQKCRTHQELVDVTGGMSWQLLGEPHDDWDLAELKIA